MGFRSNQRMLASLWSRIERIITCRCRVTEAAQPAYAYHGPYTQSDDRGLA
jgi:hypothetical protein